MISTLMTARRFAPLFWCQFCSALNDNFLKNALGMLILFGFGKELAAQPPQTAALLITLSGVVFIAPFFFLSALGGELADKYDKAEIATKVKFWEIPVAAVAAAGFYLHSIPILFLALFGFGVVGALFGPVKYGILPEKLTTSELAMGNALVEGATFMAILLGTLGGGLAATQFERLDVVVALIMALAIVCWLSARAIPRQGPAAPNIAITRNPLTSTFALLGELKADRRLAAGAHITSWFWLTGVVALSLLPVLVKTTLGGNELAYSAALMAFTVGIAVGSLVAAKASHDTPNLAVVPRGGILMAVFSAALALLVFYMSFSPVGPVTGNAARGILEIAASPLGLASAACLVGLAFAGGLFIVPSFAAVQAWAPADKRARVIASVNVLNALYMTVAGGVLAVLQAMGVPLWGLYALLAAGSLVVTLALVRPWVERAGG